MAIGNLLPQTFLNDEVPILTALKCAAEVSRQDSSIFVFTNSPTSDEVFLGRLQAMLETKNLHVHIMITDQSLSKCSLHNRNSTAESS